MHMAFVRKDVLCSVHLSSLQAFCSCIGSGVYEMADISMLLCDLVQTKKHEDLCKAFNMAESTVQKVLAVAVRDLIIQNKVAHMQLEQQ